MPVVPQADRRVAVSSQPTPTLNISKPLAASGLATLGQGLQGLGRAEGEASNVFAKRAMEMAAVDNHAFATQAVADLTIAKSNFLNGPGGLYTLQGQHAMAALPQAMADLHKLRQTYEGALSNPQAKEFYSQETDREIMFTIDQMSSYVAAQRRKFVSDSYEAGIKAAQVDAFTNRNDPAALANSFGKILSATAARDEAQGVPPEEGILNARAAVSETWKGIIARTLQQDPIAGGQLFAAHEKDLVESDAIALGGLVRSAVLPEEAARIADSVFNSAVGGGSFVTRLIGSESGGVADARNPRSTATGAGQFIESTWLRLMKGRPEAAGKSREEVLALRTDPALSRQLVEAYAAENTTALRGAGQQVNDVTLAMAHKLGPVGAVKVLQAPGDRSLADILPADVMRANPQLRGKTVGTYIAGLATEFGRPNETLELEQAREAALVAARAEAERLVPGNAVFADLVEQRVGGQFSRAISARDATISAAWDRLTTASIGGEDAAGPKIYDLATLLKSYPGAQADYHALKGPQQTRLAASLTTEGNRLTPERQNNFLDLRGRALNTPDKFVLADVSATDLTLAQSRTLIQMQQNIRARTRRAEERDPNIRAALKDPIIASMVRDQGLVVGDREYDQFTGSMIGLIENWRAQKGNEGKQPDASTLRKFASGLMVDYATGRGYDSIPDTVRDQIVNKYVAQYGFKPEPYEIAAIYRRAYGPPR